MQYKLLQLNLSTMATLGTEESGRCKEVAIIVRVNGKYEIEKYICIKNKSLQKLMDKWTL